MIDICDFNKIIELNIYFMSLQTNVTLLIIDCFYISIFDVINFFLSMIDSNNRLSQVHYDISQKSKIIQRDDYEI